MRLNEIQTQFKDLLLSPAAENIDAQFAGLFESSDIALRERLQIYRNNVVTSLGKALTGNFLLLEKLAGREFLNATARAYIMEQPPTESYLVPYGSDFGEFIERRGAAKNFPWLADIARLEVFINLSTHAPDDAPMLTTDMAKIPPKILENFHLKVRKSVFFLKSRWPLTKIREFCLDDGTEIPSLVSKGVFLMIHRADSSPIDVKVVELPESEYEFMKKLNAMPLGPALEETMGAYPDFDFQTTLQRHITLQTLLKPGKAD